MPGVRQEDTARPVTVLVVDDDELFTTALTAMLAGVDEIDVVGRARNGNEAIRLITTLRPEVITMDVDMPVTDGIEATRAIMHTMFATPIIVLTGSESSDRVAEALAAGAAAWVTKGNAQTELVPMIVRLGLRHRGRTAPGGLGA
jgi:two-component system NarL family response regulator